MYPIKPDGIRSGSMSIFGRCSCYCEFITSADNSQSGHDSNGCCCGCAPGESMDHYWDAKHLPG